MIRVSPDAGVADAGTGMPSPAAAPPWRAQFSQGLRRHAVALISLSVALFGTTYNTWRNQTTEAHRNVRSAAFIVLEQLGQLQELLDRRYYGADHSEETRIAVWGKAALVRDVATLVSPSADATARELFGAWQVNADALDRGERNAELALAQSIAGVRMRVLQELQALN